MACRDIVERRRRGLAQGARRAVQRRRWAEVGDGIVVVSHPAAPGLEGAQALRDWDLLDEEGSELAVSLGVVQHEAAALVGGGGEGGPESVQVLGERVVLGEVSESGRLDGVQAP